VEAIVQRIMAEAAAAHANNGTYFSDPDTNSNSSTKAEYEITQLMVVVSVPLLQELLL
jgi:hypothetical protein